jgi:hypothetical protein
VVRTLLLFAVVFVFTTAYGQKNSIEEIIFADEELELLKLITGEEETFRLLIDLEENEVEPSEQIIAYKKIYNILGSIDMQIKKIGSSVYMKNMNDQPAKKYLLCDVRIRFSGKTVEFNAVVENLFNYWNASLFGKRSNSDSPRALKLGLALHF